METFPIIHTNVWDAIIAIPFVLIITQLIKLLLPIKSIFVPTVANVVGLCISIFFAHRGNISAGIFMGLFYGNAAVGVYASLNTSWQAYKRKKMRSTLRVIGGHRI